MIFFSVRSKYQDLLSIRNNICEETGKLRFSTYDNYYYCKQVWKNTKIIATQVQILQVLGLDDPMILKKLCLAIALNFLRIKSKDCIPVYDKKKP